MRLTDKELELIQTEFNTNIDCGAEDEGFYSVLKKVEAELRRRYQRTTHPASSTAAKGDV